MSARIYQKPHVQTSQNFVAVARSSSETIQCKNMSCTSGFVDDVTFSRNGPGKGDANGARILEVIQPGSTRVCRENVKT